MPKMPRSRTIAPFATRLARPVLPLLLGGLGALPTCVLAAPTVYSTPGTYSYNVPAGTSALLVEVRGGAGGAGGWDDAHGGDGAGGSIITATIAVQGGETANVVVAGGGQGAQGNAGYGLGGAGGGAALSLPGAGGKGGNKGTIASSPGGAGGGGASSIAVGGATVLAGGGGGGGSNSRIRGPGNTWNIPGDPAVNNLALVEQDAACGSAQNGGDGQDGGAVDGSGGSGGGGGYAGHAGAGGNHGVDATVDQNGQPGTSGGSCTLDAGAYRVSGVSAAAGNPSVANRTQKGTPEASGEDGSVTITAIPAVLYTVTPNAGAHGSIDPATPQSVQSGKTVAFTVTPDAGYTIDSVSGCGGSLSGNAYTTAAVIADCTVTASFKATSAPPPANATAVPTLGAWGLVLLSLLASVLGLRGLRRRA